MNAIAIILFAMLLCVNAAITLVMCFALARGIIDWFKSIIRNTPMF